MALTFDEAQQLAIETSTCFCVCGCMDDGVPAGKSFLGTMPGICKRCKASRKGQHERIATPAMYEVSQSIEDEAVEPLPRVKRSVSETQRRQATVYAEKVGTEVGPTLAPIIEKVTDGEELTAAQVETVLRSKRADERVAASAKKRLTAEHERIGRQVDLVSLRIPETVAEGTYAVMGDGGDAVRIDIDRPTEGELSGWTVVKLELGEGVVHYGVQRPKRLWRNPAYRGWFPQLVAKVIENPDKARTRYKQLMGEA